MVINLFIKSYENRLIPHRSTIKKKTKNLRVLDVYNIDKNAIMVKLSTKQVFKEL